MTRIGIMHSLYAKFVEHRPFSRFTGDPAEIQANQEWCKRACAWGEEYDKKHGLPSSGMHIEAMTKLP